MKIIATVRLLFVSALGIKKITLSFQLNQQVRTVDLLNYNFMG